MIAKNKLKGELRSYFEEDNEVMSAFLLDKMHVPFGLESLSSLITIIDSITINDIQKYSKYVFNDKPKYAIIANSKVANDNAEFFNNLGIVEKR